MDVSIIIPVLNEEAHIEELLSSIYNTNDCSIEVFICDAGSTDQTLTILNNLKFPNLHIVHNPQRFVSFAFNNTFPKTKGQYVALLGAHAYYPKHYLDHAIAYLKTECDVVGGPLIQLGKTTTGKAIAIAMSSKFGVGGTEFRTEKKKMRVDSVAFAVYKRSIFETIGLLDETLIRNQDDEIHYRMNSKGYKLLMVPEMECTYYVRDSFGAVFSQYFQYGFYKPLVFAKVKSSIRLRHIVPSLFVAYFFSIPLLWMMVGNFSLYPLCLYFLLAIVMAARSSVSLVLIVNIITAFVTLHVSYGSGFILGLPKYFRYQSNNQ